MNRTVDQEQTDFQSHRQSHRKERGHSPIHWIMGLMTLVLRSGSELTKVVGEIHHTASESPWPWDKNHQPNVAHAPKPYVWIKLLLEHVANNIHRAIDQLPSKAFPQPLNRVRSAMNGVLGDKLHDWDHPLTQTMEIVDEHGHKESLARLADGSQQGVVLFIHGLCLSEYDWQSPAHSDFVETLRSQGFGVAWLRYNTGLPIWENGELLSQIIEEDWSNARTENKAIRLIGHSMGGLILRSAVHHAKHDFHHKWVSALTHSAYISAPHDGAPLEKIGDMANKLLGNTAYTKPLMALGNIRSRGIRSLRHGNVTKPDNPKEHQSPLPFHEECDHLLVGALLNQDPSNVWVGDGLVPEKSAMGGPHFPEYHYRVERVMLDDVGHLKMLHDKRTYDAIQQWFNAGEVIDVASTRQD